MPGSVRTASGPRITDAPPSCPDAAFNTRSSLRTTRRSKGRAVRPSDPPAGGAENDPRSPARPGVAGYERRGADAGPV